MKVIIAEKPSVAKNIADALGIKKRQDGYLEGTEYIVTWAFGHLWQLYDAKDYDEKMTKWAMDKFPFIPEKFQYKVKSSQANKDVPDLGAKKQLRIIKSLFHRKDVTEIISACDYDREGQIIGDTIIYLEKTNKQISRLLLNEWTPDEVIRGLQHMRPNTELRPLQDAGISRQWADWIIGINLTSVATLKYQKGSGKALTIGRVVLPTLKMIYDRDKEIASFVPENYFKLVATFSTKNKELYKGVYTEKNQDQFKDKQTLEEIKNKLHTDAIVTDKKVEKKKEYPPFLFNLSSLQGYMTSKYKGWTSDKVLKVAQALYEKKFITYPRTSSVVLEESLVGKVAKVVEVLKKGLAFSNEINFVKSKRIFNNAKVESHSAIIPTYMIPSTISSDERLVYEAIKNRFLMQFMPVAEYEETKLTTKTYVDLQGVFISKGKIQLVEGWKKLDTTETKDTFLPNVKEQEQVDIKEAEVTSHTTQPPKRHTERTLLRLMETCGKSYDDEESTELMETVMSGFSIGTPATRAETIKKLKDVGYISIEGKNLLCTELGKNLVDTFPVRELFDLPFTGRLEKALSDMEKRKVSRQTFLEFIFSFTKEAVEKVKQAEMIILKEVEKEKVDIEILGICPLCKGQVAEGQKGFGCANWKQGCKFVVWKNDKFFASMKKKVTKTLVKTLLKNGKVTVKGLTSKTGKTFDGVFSYEKNKENDYFSWKMEFE